MIRQLVLKTADLILFRLLGRQDPPVDLQSWCADNDVPGTIFRGDRDLLRKFTGVGTGLPTFMIINHKLEVVYLSRGFDPENFERNIREAITCNIEYCDPDSAYAKSKGQYRGMTVPDEALLPLNSEERVKLSALINENSVAVIDFWATWCPPCLLAFKSLETLHGVFSEKGVAFLSINAAN